MQVTMTGGFRQLLTAILSLLLAAPVFSKANDQLGTDTYDYDAFGNLLHSTGTTYNNYLFAGEQFDSDLNLYYNRARYLNASTGRFWTADTLEGIDSEPRTLHRYVYASNDSVNSTDPSGQEELTLGAQIPAAALYVTLAASSVLTLAYVCVAAAALGGGRGPCGGGNQQQNEGRMRIQLQLGLTFTVPNTPVLINRDPPGVTIVQVRSGLEALFALAQTGLARFPFNSLRSDLVSAVVLVSAQAGRYVPAGWGIPTKGLLSAPIGNSGWRIDVDNLQGTNLRQ